MTPKIILYQNNFKNPSKIGIQSYELFLLSPLVLFHICFRIELQAIFENEALDTFCRSEPFTCVPLKTRTGHENFYRKLFYFDHETEEKNQEPVLVTNIQVFI